MVNTKAKTNFLLVTYVTGLIGFVFLRDYFDMGFNKYIIVVFCSVFYFMVPHNTLVNQLFFTFPLLYGLPGKIIIPIAAVALLVKKQKIDNTTIFLMIYFILSEVIAQAIHTSFDLSNEIGYLANLFFFIYLARCIRNEDIVKNINLFCLGLSYVCFVIIVTTIKRAPANWFSQLATGYFRFGVVENEENSMRMTMKANTLSFCSITGISCILTLLVNKDKKLNFACGAELAVLLAAGLLSFSRTWFLDLGVMLILMILFNGPGIKGALRSIFIVLLMVLALFIVAQNFPEITDGIVKRFTRSDFSTGNGRTDLFLLYWDAFWRNTTTVFFGTGVIDYQEVIGLPSAHNGLMQVLVCYGIVGSFAFMYAWLSPVVKRIGKTELSYWIPFICIFLYGLTVQMINPSTVLYLHLAGILVLCMGKKHEKNK